MTATLENTQIEKDFANPILLPERFGFPALHLRHSLKRFSRVPSTFSHFFLKASSSIIKFIHHSIYPSIMQGVFMPSAEEILSHFRQYHF